MPVLVSRLGRPRVRVGTALVSRMAERMLRALRLEEAELSIVLADDAHVRAMNREHRDEDHATDVLAYAQYEDALTGRFAAHGSLLGDVVVSLDTAASQARAHRVSLESELGMLIAHGLLHLCGCDHRDAAEARRMKARTQLLAHAGTTKRSRERPSKAAEIAPPLRRRGRKTR